MTSTSSPLIDSFALWAVLASLLCGASALLVLYGSVALVRRRALRLRLASIAATDVALDQEAGQSGGRPAQRVLVRLGQLVALVLPAKLQNRLQLLSVQAGLTGRPAADALLGVRVLAVVLGGWVAYAFANSGRGALGTLGAVLVAALAALGVDLYLRSRVQRRRRAAERDLPTVLDLLTLTLAAGMGFDNALETILVHFHGPLAEELTRYLVETRQLGAERTVALREVATRVGDPPDLVDFAEAVNRAQLLGTGLLAAVDAQVGLLRQERHRRVASAAQRAPVRMLIPMTLFMLPVLMLVVLAPVGLRVLNATGGLH